MNINGIPVYVSGIPGHFIASHRCSLILHWRIGDIRVSTVGGYADGEPIGCDRWSETMVVARRIAELLADNPTPTDDEIDAAVADAQAEDRTSETGR